CAGPRPLRPVAPTGEGHRGYPGARGRSACRWRWCPRTAAPRAVRRPRLRPPARRHQRAPLPAASTFSIPARPGGAVRANGCRPPFPLPATSRPPPCPPPVAPALASRPGSPPPSGGLRPPLRPPGRGRAGGGGLQPGAQARAGRYRRAAVVKGARTGIRAWARCGSSDASPRPERAAAATPPGRGWRPPPPPPARRARTAPRGCAARMAPAAEPATGRKPAAAARRYPRRARARDIPGPRSHRRPAATGCRPAIPALPAHLLTGPCDAAGRRSPSRGGVAATGLRLATPMELVITITLSWANEKKLISLEKFLTQDVS